MKLKIQRKIRGWRLRWSWWRHQHLHFPLVRRRAWVSEMEARYRAEKRIAELMDANESERVRLADLIARFTQLTLEMPDRDDPNFYLKLQLAPEIFYHVYRPGELDAMWHLAKYVAFAIEREIMKLEIRYRETEQGKTRNTHPAHTGRD